mmetsp:Transcript_47929/g.88905  ORF Transcript_47929/g.88905 Transcript_47929/m.88905 type:complete len:232 (+) Transcript_47929:445-1140(+)
MCLLDRGDILVLANQTFDLRLNVLVSAFQAVFKERHGIEVACVVQVCGPRLVLVLLILVLLITQFSQNLRDFQKLLWVVGRIHGLVLLFFDSSTLYESASDCVKLDFEGHTWKILDVSIVDNLIGRIVHFQDYHHLHVAMGCVLSLNKTCSCLCDAKELDAIIISFHSPCNVVVSLYHILVSSKNKRSADNVLDAHTKPLLFDWPIDIVQCLPGCVFLSSHDLPCCLLEGP